jgi:TolB protein
MVNRVVRWSPDGRRIVFMSDQQCEQCVHTMNSHGTDFRQITRTMATDWSPAWSPDARRIVFGRDGDICTMNPDESGLRRLTTSPRLDGEPDWAPTR